MMLLGYNTNGFAHHDLFDAVNLLREIGYRSVAVTIDHGPLSPWSRYRRQQVARLKRLLDELEMRSVIETGARFLLDPGQKHEPTLLSADRRRRIDFYRYAVDCAAELGSDCVSIWSGTVHDSAAERSAMDRLAEGLEETLAYAAQQGVAIGFEPEPGMLVDSMDRFEQLLGRIDDDDLRLTLDVGHLHCQRETPIAEQIRRWAPRLVNVHIEDMRAGTHQHLMFGEGEIDFPPVLQALRECGYTGGVHVELSRHSRDAPRAARRAFEFLSPLIEAEGRGVTG